MVNEGEKMSSPFDGEHWTNAAAVGHHSFNAVRVYPLRIVGNGSTLTTEMEPPFPLPVSRCETYMSRMRYTAAGAVGATQPSVRSPTPPAPLPPKRRPTYVVALAPDLALLLWVCKGTHQDQFFVTLNSTQYKADLPPSSSRPFPPIPILVHDTHRHTSSLHSSPKKDSIPGSDRHSDHPSKHHIPRRETLPLPPT